MTVPRPLRPFVRTRARLTCTALVLVAVLTVALLPAQPRQQIRAATPAPTALSPEAAARAEARRTGHEILIDAATTATAQTWALPDGQFRTTVHAVPQRERDASGQWAPIDTGLRKVTAPVQGLGIEPANVPGTVRFASGSPASRPSPLPSAGSSSGGTGGAAGTPLPEGHTPLAEVSTNGHTITYTWPGVLPEPVLDGPRALYPDVFQGVDLLLVAREEGGFGQLLIVKDRSAVTGDALQHLAFGLHSSSAVFRYNETTSGISVIDPGSGDEIASVPTPFGWDSAGTSPESPDAQARTSVATPADVLKLSGLIGMEPGARQDTLTTRLDGNDTGSALIHLDTTTSDLLTSSNTRFPVFLDPTLYSGVLQWTFVSKKHPNSSFYNGTNYNGGTTEARVGYESDSGVTARSFWRMEYRSAIHDADISSAKFRIRNTHSWSCDAREIQLWRTEAISSSTTWNKQPGWKAVQQKMGFAHGYSSACPNADVEFDALEAAQYGEEKSSSTLTFGMRATNESDTYAWRKFLAAGAELTVKYNHPPAEPTDMETNPGGDCSTAGTIIAKTDITLSATGKDADGAIKKIHFRFWKSGTTAPTPTAVNPDPNGVATLIIPTDRLTDQSVYYWDALTEDSDGAKSAYGPPGTTSPCKITIDATAPPAPTITSNDFPKATPDGATWSKVEFGSTGKVTFQAAGATTFSYAFEGIGYQSVTATNEKAEVTDLRPRHAGPTYLLVYAFDAVGNRSLRTDYNMYVRPSVAGDGPGDDIPDFVVINDSGILRTFSGDAGGELYAGLHASYNTKGKFNPDNLLLYNTASTIPALITKYSDAYPGDGITDLFVRTTDGDFWLYPGDGYGSFNTDHRLRVILPANTPASATWTQIKAVGDVTGDQLPDLFLRTTTGLWALTGYTGGSFQQATLLENTAWGPREIVNVADIDRDGTPDLLWRNLSTIASSANVAIRHGKPGPTAGSVDLVSLKYAVNSREGKDTTYASGWTSTAVTNAIGIPDANGDDIPDIWVRDGTTGNILLYYGTTTGVTSPRTVLSTDWRNYKALG